MCVAAVEENGASELLFWKRLLTSNLAALGVDEDPETEEVVEAPVEVEDVEAEEVEVEDVEAEEVDVAVDDAGSGGDRLRLGSGCAGEACAPDFETFEDVRAPPFLNAAPCPNVIGRLERVGGAEGAAGGGGDCGRGDGAVEVFAGGPLARAEFDGSWVDDGLVEEEVEYVSQP